MSEPTEQPQRKPVRVKLKNVAAECVAELLGEEVALQVEQCQVDKINNLTLKAFAETQTSTSDVEPIKTSDVEPVKRDLNWFANGAKQAAKALLYPETEQSNARLDICKSCEHWTGHSCKLCGCFVKLKVKIPEEKCPAGKW